MERLAKLTRRRSCRSNNPSLAIATWKDELTSPLAPTANGERPASPERVRSTDEEADSESPCVSDQSAPALAPSVVEPSGRSARFDDPMPRTASFSWSIV